MSDKINPFSRVSPNPSTTSSTLDLNDVVYESEKLLADLREFETEMVKQANSLNKIADLCVSEYSNCQRQQHKELVFNQSKLCTTQSLICVAQQIGFMSNYLVRLLNNQSFMVHEISRNVNEMRMKTRIQSERQARVALGKFVTNKMFIKGENSNESKNGEKMIRSSASNADTSGGSTSTTYERKSIDYSILDDVGIGQKIKSFSKDSGSLDNSFNRSLSIRKDYFSMLIK